MMSNPVGSYAQKNMRIGGVFFVPVRVSLSRSTSAAIPRSNFSRVTSVLQASTDTFCVGLAHAVHIWPAKNLIPGECGGGNALDGIPPGRGLKVVRLHVRVGRSSCGTLGARLVRTDLRRKQERLVVKITVAVFLGFEVLSDREHYPRWCRLSVRISRRG
mmetsp:Transcript_43060/g.113470  ORF Transcript_43060/g.113470 Transcript_43060/m.113470 type:complete len:160 (-) Transcript_43060:264-743(-)